MARTKTVFPTEEIAHLWMHGIHPSGRNAQSNFSWNDYELYSYATVIGTRVQNKRGKAVLINIGCYSNTTAKHQHHASRAVPSSAAVFRVRGAIDKYRFDKKAIMTDYIERTVSLSALHDKARQRKAEYAERLLALVDEANRFAAFFGLRTRLKPDLAEVKESIAKAVATQQRAKRKENAAYKKKLEEQRLKADGERELWLSGDLEHYSTIGLPYETPVRLRIKGDEVQTSLGARIPLLSAKVLHEFIKKNKPWSRDPEHTRYVGGYPLEAINADGDIVVGCHRISNAELQRIATQLGLE